jgi:hypothetical protein
VKSQLFNEKIDLCDLWGATTPPQTLDNRRYKCNRMSNAMALNRPHSMQKIVPKILKCRNFRGNESEREEAGFSLWCRSTRIYADAKTTMELSLKDIARITKP